MNSEPNFQFDESYSTLGAETASRAISRITVNKLYGRYSYNIPDEQTGQGESLPLLILYGDNGAGKTTILSLVYHLLSSSPKRGHHSFIAKTPFQRFSVELSNNTVVTADRRGTNIVGSYQITVSRNGDNLVTHDVIANDDLAVKTNIATEDSHRHLLAELDNLDVAVYFLSDD